MTNGRHVLDTSIARAALGRDAGRSNGIGPLIMGVVVAVVAVVLFVAGITLAAQDRFALKTPNGIAFSEFKDYEAWQVIAPALPDDAGGCGLSPAPGCIKAIVGNPVMIEAYKAGIPANGRSVPDGAAMAKLEWQKGHPAASAYRVTVPGAFSEVSFR